LGKGDYIQGLQPCESTIYLFKNVFAKMLLIKKPKERFAKNKQAKELIIRDMALKSKEGINSNIYSIISFLTFLAGCFISSDI
jgi:hypothetical protein